MKLTVDVNFRMSETGRWADVILPAAYWYEKTDLKYLVSFIPYVHLGDRAAPPLGEAKPEWEIFASARRRRRRARRSGATCSRTPTSARCERDARRLDEAFTDRGRFGPARRGEGAGVRAQLLVADEEGVARRPARTPAPCASAAPARRAARRASTATTRRDEPLVPHRWFVEKKQRWPTLTGRQQFYIDHPWFLECGEALPTHKPPPQAGGDYPLVLSGGHTRWSIHSQWRDQGPLLRLQRGEPVVYLNDRDAAARGINDHDLVRVRNDLGAFVLRAKIGALRAARPGVRLPRLGAVPVPRRPQRPRDHSEPVQAHGAGRRLRPAALDLRTLGAEPGRSRHAR